MGEIDLDELRAAIECEDYEHVGAIRDVQAAAVVEVYGPLLLRGQ